MPLTSKCVPGDLVDTGSVTGPTWITRVEDAVRIKESVKQFALKQGKVRVGVHGSVVKQRLLKHRLRQLRHTGGQHKPKKNDAQTAR